MKNTNTINKTDVLGITLKVMKDIAPGCEPVLVNAETTVLINVLKTVCYITEAPRYDHFKKYNLVQLAIPDTPAQTVPDNKSDETTTSDSTKTRESSEAKPDGTVEDGETEEKKQDSSIESTEASATEDQASKSAKKVVTGDPGAVADSAADSHSE